MSGLFLPGEKIPTGCIDCNYRDAEYGNCCMLMPHTDYRSFSEQFAVCPKKSVYRGAIKIDSEEDLIGRNQLIDTFCCWLAGAKSEEEKDAYRKCLENVVTAPTVIQKPGG